MGLWTKEQLRAFIKENKLVTAQDAQNALKERFAETLQEMLEAELDTHLGYEKHEVKAKMTPNSRNGKSKKTVVSEYGEQEITVPRDRLGEFESVVVQKHQKNVTGIEDQMGLSIVLCILTEIYKMNATILCNRSLWSDTTMTDLYFFIFVDFHFLN